MYHFDVKIISRRKGQSVVAVIAYRSGKKLYDRYYGEFHDFTKKGGIVHSWIILPPNAPEKYSGRETLWNEVEQNEKRRDSRLAREVEIALPVELTTLEEKIRLVERYVIANFVERGMIADISLHDKGDGNPHAHILLTTREVDPDGFGLKNRDWDKRANVTTWRKEWENELNHEYERKGIEKRVDHESYAVQGISLIPKIHLGHQVKKLERNGIETDRGNEYRAIIESRERAEQERQRKKERQQRRRRERER